MKKNLILLLTTILTFSLLQAVAPEGQETRATSQPMQSSQPKSVKELRAFYESEPLKTEQKSSQEVGKLKETQLAPFKSIVEKAKELEDAGNFEALKLLMDIGDIVDDPEEFNRLEKYVENRKKEIAQATEQMKAGTRGTKKRGTISPELYQKPEGPTIEMPAIEYGTSEYKPEVPTTTPWKQ